MTVEDKLQIVAVVGTFVSFWLGWFAGLYQGGQKGESK